MAPVTVDTSAKNGYYSAGNIGWSAHSLIPYHTAVQQLVGSTGWTMGSVATTARYAQSITPSTTFDVSSFVLPVYKTGAPVDDSYVEICADDGTSKPSGTVLATSDVINGAALGTTTPSWIPYVFSTTYTLHAGVKYWFSWRRSGAIDGANYYAIGVSGSSLYADGGVSTYNSTSGLWGAESSTVDLGFQLMQVDPVALYHVTQDTSLHIWRSTDLGVSWSEQHSAGAPTVTNANYPFDAVSPANGPFITTARMTATNTAAVRVFYMSSNQWSASDYGTSPPSTVSNERNIRLSMDNAGVTGLPGAVVMTYTDSADDADIAYQRVTASGSAWGAKVSVAAVTSTEASTVSEVVMDRANPGFAHRFYYEVTADDYIDRSLTVTTQGTATALAATAADIETEHASATYQTYIEGAVTRVIAAYINASGEIWERITRLDVTSASITLSAGNKVTTAITSAGRQLATLKYGTTNYIFGAVSGTGISYYTSTTPGTWSAATAWKTGLTNCVLSQAIAIRDVGIIVAYTDNGDAKIDWITAPFFGANATITNDTLTLTEQTVTGTATASATITNAALTLTEQTLTAGAGASATIANDTLTLVGQTLTAFGQRNETATIANASLTLVEQTLTATAGASATIANDTLSLVEQTLTATAGASATIANDTLTLTAQTLSATAGASATIANDTLDLVEQTLTATAGAAATITNDTLTLTEQTLTATAGASATIANDVLTLTGQTVTASASVSVAVTNAVLTLVSQTLSALGVTSVVDAAAFITNATLSLVGQTVTAIGQRHESATIANATLTLTEQTVTATAGASATIANDVLTLVEQTLSATASASATIANDTLTLVEQTLTAGAGAGATVTNATLSLVEQTIGATAGASATIANDTLTLVEQTLTATAGTGASATITNAVINLIGQTLDAFGQRNENATINTAILTLHGQLIDASVAGNKYPWDNGVVVTVVSDTDLRSSSSADLGPRSKTAANHARIRSVSQSSNRPRTRSQWVGNKPRTTDD